MSKYEKVPVGSFDEMTYGAGIIVSDFDPETGTVEASAIKYLTKGGNVFTATREITDTGADYDNLPENVMQLQKPRPFQASVSGTAVTTTADKLREILGNADVSGDIVKKVSPRDYFDISDFNDIWLITNYSSDNTEETGGFVAFHLMNTLNVEGLNATFVKDANGEFPYNFKAFYDMDNMDIVPFEIYVKHGGGEGG